MNATLHKKRPVAHWLVGEQRLRPPHDRHTTATRPPHDRHMVKRVKRAHTHAAAPEVFFNRIYTPVPGGVGRPFIRFTRFTMWRSCGGRVAVVWRSCGGRVAVVWRPFGGYSVRSTTSPPQPSEMLTQYGGKAKGRQDVLNVTSSSGRIYQIPQTVDEQNPAPLVEPAPPCTPIHNIELVACL